MSGERSVTVVGAGPAGSSAALTAALHGAHVRLYEKKSAARHKVCGEFLSPALVHVLERLELGSEFAARRAAPIRRAALHFARRTKRFELKETAFGFSRLRLDELLLAGALRRGAELTRSAAPPYNGETRIVATGRQTSNSGKKGDRLFGFKAHYSGPQNDAVELFFFEECYVGVNPIENGLTNVCGLGPERRLKRVGFDFDELLHRSPKLRERVAPLARVMDWLTVGPLEFTNRFATPPLNEVYEAGDALSFVDPFTGSGLLSAILTGTLAGEAAARGLPSAAYRRKARALLERPFALSGLLRRVPRHPLALSLVSLVPGSVLFRLTRPRL